MPVGVSTTVYGCEVKTHALRTQAAICSGVRFLWAVKVGGWACSVGEAQPAATKSSNKILGCAWVSPGRAGMCPRNARRNLSAGELLVGHGELEYLADVADVVGHGEAATAFDERAMGAPDL